MDPFLPDDAKLAAIRELLPSVGSGIRLDVTVAGPIPAETHRALLEADDWELRTGRGGPDRADDLVQRAAEARAVVAAVLSADPDRLVLAAGPMSILGGLVAPTASARARRIAMVGELRAELEASIRAFGDATGTTIDQLPDGSAGELAPGTVLVVTSHVDVRSGMLRDAEPVVLAARAADALSVIDAAWSVGAVPVDGPGMGADVVLSDGHRWLLGPEGVTAAVLGSRLDAPRLAGLLDPLPRGALLGLARSVGWLLMYVGLPWAFERAERLASLLRERLARFDGVELRTGQRGMSTTVPFRIAGWAPEEAIAELGRRCFAVLGRDDARGTLLASVGAWNRDDELDRFAAAVGDLAGHTPETLPRRPLLTLLGDDGAPRVR